MTYFRLYFSNYFFLFVHSNMFEFVYGLRTWPMALSQNKYTEFSQGIYILLQGKTQEKSQPLRYQSCKNVLAT